MRKAVLAPLDERKLDFHYRNHFLYAKKLQNNQMCHFKFIKWLILKLIESKLLLSQFMLTQHLDTGSISFEPEPGSKSR